MQAAPIIVAKISTETTPAMMEMMIRDNGEEATRGANVATVTINAAAVDVIATLVWVGSEMRV